MNTPKKGFTKIPDHFLDQQMRYLSLSELKVVLVILRKTLGWNKKVDQISHTQFMEITGLSRRAVTEGIRGLENKKIAQIEDERGQILSSIGRKFQLNLYYRWLPPKADSSRNPRQNLPSTIYRDKQQKRALFKSDKERIQEIFRSKISFDEENN